MFVCLYVRVRLPDSKELKQHFCAPHSNRYGGVVQKAAAPHTSLFSSSLSMRQFAREWMLHR